jgi:hypothetical protein
VVDEEADGHRMTFAPAVHRSIAVADPAQFTEPPVIIGGCARSGTTLLISILSCHPNIHTILTETQLLCIGAFDKPPTCRPPDLAALYDWLHGEKIQETARRWCEKTPRNALCFAQIREALPDAKLVSVVRDGRDVCTSRHPGNPTDYWVPAGRWLREIEAAECATNVYTLRYEDIVLNYEPAMFKLLAWIGEDWHPRLYDYPAHALITESGAWSHPAIPLYSTTIGRWAAPEHADRLAEFYAQPGTREMLERLGYEV